LDLGFFLPRGQSLAKKCIIVSFSVELSPATIAGVHISESPLRLIQHERGWRRRELDFPELEVLVGRLVGHLGSSTQEQAG
jgi:hypothetical protein